ncbi:hypothetical protein [Bacillus rubiinfantis]|uniref:hypothetical protein n=1 Tax=Bacillus rubiinfantis TaxID=1499680 RepID=UPI0005A9FEEF|nr:hypothetical protein [Bacillus rubiinfantis]
MDTFVAYFVTFTVIVISVFITLLVKNELEQLFREDKDSLVFHICNVIIILMVSFAAYAVMTSYIIGETFNLIVQLIILLFMVVPIYLVGYFAFEKYKLVYRKYAAAEDGKVLVLNEKYLKKKRRFKSLKQYNAISKENARDQR